MKNAKMNIIVFLAITLAFIVSCGKMLEPELKGRVVLDNLLKTEEGIKSIVNGMYQPLQTLYMYDKLLYLTILPSDDGWMWQKAVESDLFAVESNFPYFRDVWAGHYTGINRANIVLSNLALVKDANDNAKRTLEGQAKFMRAFYYFNLVRIFGGVPLIIKEIKSGSDAEQPRESIINVYNLIKNDLNQAIPLLPVSYAGKTGEEIGRPTTYTASALLALVHLELEEWDKAANVSSSVIGKGNILVNYADNFNGKSENGPGSLFEVQYGGVSTATTSSISNVFAPTNLQGSSLILPTDDNLGGNGAGLSSGNGFVQAFETGDLRKSVILQSYGLQNFIDVSKPKGSLFYVNKYYNNVNPVGLSTWNFPLIRYAEILLVRSEALNEQGYVPNGEAFNLINMIRSNAGLPAYKSTDLPDQASFRKALRKERRIELAFECKRYFDLNRWGILQEVIQPQLDFRQLQFPVSKMINHPITGKKYYLNPIPINEFNLNSNLGDQNPGY
ncbi:MAG: RagB/SusD family nutrient uptake outer membrane protein [Daejeonella sp.]